jgi:hypothetical protein
MTYREQLAARGRAALAKFYDSDDHGFAGPVWHAEVVHLLDAVVPEVSTVTELKALRVSTVAVDSDGDAWTHLRQGVWQSYFALVSAERLASRGPVMVMWQPEPEVPQ